MNSPEPEPIDSKSQPLFVRDWRRQQIMIVTMMIALLAAAVVYPIAMIAIWAVGLPVIGYRMWQLRCWNCHRRLLADGGAEIEWKKKGWFNWVPARHKACGALLIQ
jgi:hypothetical protein